MQNIVSYGRKLAHFLPSSRLSAKSIPLIPLNEEKKKSTSSVNLFLSGLLMSNLFIEDVSFWLSSDLYLCLMMNG